MLSWLLSPLRGGLLLAFSLWLLWRWLPRWLRAIGISGLAIAWVLTTPLGANSLVSAVESGAPTAADCRGPLPSTIVLLGGGALVSTRDPLDYRVLSPPSIQRVFASARLARQQPDAQIVISGDSFWGVPESTLMARLLTELGIAPERIREEPTARTTWQNAQFTAALQPPIAHRVWLVTSALHMPRALYAFQQAGFDACAWPAESRYAGWIGWGYLLPSSSAIVKSEAALHELLGGFAYRHGWLRQADRNPSPDSGEG
ncbi:MAG: YdcF family protein [Dokdonella sp.]